MTQAQFEVRKNGSDNGALIASRTDSKPTNPTPPGAVSTFSL